MGEEEEEKVNDKEYCVLCTNPTEKAGIDEDSIYIEVGPFYEIGPLCDDCFKLLEDNFCRALRTRIAELEAENSELTTAVVAETLKARELEAKLKSIDEVHAVCVEERNELIAEIETLREEIDQVHEANSILSVANNQDYQQLRKLRKVLKAAKCYSWACDLHIWHIEELDVLMDRHYFTAEDEIMEWRDTAYENLKQVIEEAQR